VGHRRAGGDGEGACGEGEARGAEGGGEHDGEACCCWIGGVLGVRGREVIEAIGMRVGRLVEKMDG
jgi:hypothetical protein